MKLDRIKMFDFGLNDTKMPFRISALKWLSSKKLEIDAKIQLL